MALSSGLPLGPLLVPWPPLVMVLAWVGAVLVADATARRGWGRAEPWLLPLALLGLLAARVAYVLRHLQAYDSIPAMLDLRDRGFDVLAGALAVALALAWLMWRRPALRRSLAASVAVAAAVVLAALAVARVDQAARPPLPDLRLESLDGGGVDLAQLRGRPLVLNIWATWCPPCRRELPMLVRQARQRGDVRIVLVDAGEAPARVGAFLREQGLRPPLVLLDANGALQRHYAVAGYPTTLFIGADGTLRQLVAGELSAATLDDGIAAARGTR